LQWLRYPKAQVVIFDKDRSSRSATLAVQGDYYEPGGEKAALAFQPLAAIDDPAERIWASSFILLLLREQNLQETPVLKKEIDDALQNLATSERSHRTLTVFSDLVQSREVRDALRPYTMQGNYGEIFDADTDTMRDGAWITIEMNALMTMSPEVVIPGLFYLFHRVEQRFDGRPTLLILDEAWLFLKHPVFMGQLQNWLKTLRKKHVSVVFATQEIADAAESPIMATILSACHTKLYLPDEEALTPAMTDSYRKFGLSDTEIMLLATAQKKRDYYYRSVKGRRLFTLNMGPVALAFAGLSNPDDQRFMDSIEEVLSKEAHASALLRHRGLEWAAELLEQIKGQSSLQS
jgi:type IV secretion system protein VirB4